MTAPHTSLSIRLAGAAFATLASLMTLGLTVSGMQAKAVHAPHLVAMDAVTVNATRLN